MSILPIVITNTVRGSDKEHETLLLGKVIGLLVRCRSTQRMTLPSQGSEPFNHPGDLIQRFKRSIKLRAAGEIVSDKVLGGGIRLHSVTVIDTLVLKVKYSPSLQCSDGQHSRWNLGSLLFEDSSSATL